MAKPLFEHIFCVDQAQDEAPYCPAINSFNCAQNFVGGLHASQQLFSHVGMFPRLNQNKAEDKCFAQGPLVRLEPATPQSQVEHSVSVTDLSNLFKYYTCPAGRET